MRIIPKPMGAFEIENIRIIPRIEQIAAEDVDISTNITQNVKLKVPFVPSPMDSVVNFDIAKLTIEMGSVPIIYVNKNKIADSLQLVNKLRNSFNSDINIGICISPNLEVIKLADKLINNVDIVALDTLHSMPYKHLEAIEYLRKNYGRLDIISGNITNSLDCERVINCGVNSVRIGMTSNSVNQGSDIIGCGRMQGSSIYECSKIASKYKIPLIADGGIKSPRDIGLALALGADCVMIGKMFASMAESPCQTLQVEDEQYKYYLYYLVYEFH